MSRNKLTENTWIRKNIAGAIAVILLSGFVQYSFAQETSLDNYTGNWSSNSTWVSGTAPGTTGINVDITIFGFVTRYGDLNFNNGDLYVNDTLVIYGSLDLGNNANLFLGAGAILIVRGDYTSGNQVDVANGGILVVTGNWEMLGADNQGAFDNDGQLYILDPDPDLKTGTGFEDFTCTDPVDSCQQYGYEELINSGIGDFFLGGTYTIDTSGVTSFCPGESVTLTATDTATNYQWYRDGVALTGETTYTYTATSSGDYHVEFVIINATLVLSAITVTVDTLPPVISTCATDKILSADASCEAPVPDLTTEIVASDNCATSLTITQSPAAGTMIGLGITTVTIYVTDDVFNTDSCTVNVTVIDDVNPTITAPANVAVNNNAGVCFATGVVLGTATTADNCGVASTTNNAPASFPVGVTTVTWTVTDNAGLTATANQLVTVTDTENPFITAPADVIISNDPGLCTATGVGLGTPTSSDNCGIASTSNNAPATFPLGPTTVTWTVTDDAGLTATANQLVTVVDNENPTINAPANLTVGNDPGVCTASSVDPGIPTVTDNCVIASTVNDAPATLPLGSTTVTWTITDNAGNTATDTQVITVIDNEDPTITVPADVIVNSDPGLCTASGVVLGAAVTADNCGVASVTNNAPATFPLGPTTVTWTVTDNAGLTTTADQLVTVIDNEDPTITAPANVTVNSDPGVCSAAGVVLGAAITSDNCGIASTTNNAPAIFPVGITTVTWTVTDDAGLTATADQLVTVVDNENPAINAPVDIIVSSDPGVCTAGSVTLGIPTVSDNCSVSSTVNDAPATFPLGPTTVTWTVTDNSGNTTTATQQVTVIDSEDPTITAPVDVTVSSDPGLCTATGVALGAPVTFDNCGIASVTNNAPATFPLGPTTVTWTITDNAGLTATADQLVTVADNEDPTITAPADVITDSDPGICTATGVVLGTPVTSDNCGIASVTNNAPATFPLGTTTVTWTITDNAGLTATADQLVTVVDNEDPTITAPTDVTVNNDLGLCIASGVALGTPTTFDNCGIASVTNNAPATFPLGPTTVTWTITDNAGLTATADQQVTVVDSEDPTITAPADIITDSDPGLCTAAGLLLGAATTADNCGVATVTNNAPATFPLGTTTVTWTVTDNSGLTATADQLVTVVDNEDPTITAPTDVIIDSDPGICTASGVVLGTPVTSDNCGIASVTNNAPATFPLGLTTVTWTITDNAGLTATADQLVTVVDNEDPTITAPADVTVNNDAGLCTASGVALGAPTTFDNCGIASVTNNAPATFPVGPTTVTWTITDDAGLTATADQLVTVTDSEDPTITAPADLIVNSDPGVCTATGVVLGAAVTTDNCGIASTVNDAPATFPQGETIVTWTVTDNSGLTGTATQKVTVLENEDPVLTGCPADFSVPADDEYCGSTVSWTEPTATDNCSVTLTSTHNPGDLFLIGTTTVTYTATDASGNSVSCSFDITVDPPLPVVIEGATDVCSPGEETYTLPGLAGKSYAWSVDQGTITGSSTDQDVVVNWTGTAAGTLSVTVTSGSGCTATGSLGITKIAGPETSELRSRENPTSLPGYLSEVCPGDTGLYYAVTGTPGSTPAWTVEGGIITRDYGDSVIVDWGEVPGEYSITVQETSGNGCAGELISGTVNVTSISIELGNDTSICEGDLFILNPAGDYQSITWHDGSGTAAYQASSEGLISCTVVNEAGCSMSDELYLTVNVRPQVDLGMDTAICDDYLLDAGSEAVIYRWSTGESTRQIAVSPGQQDISVEVENDFGCTDRDTVLIEECNEASEFENIPNAITPNEDGKNDVWIIDELRGFPDVVVEIYDRWGRLVYKSEAGYPTPWDGTNMNGKHVPAGAYFYVLMLNKGDYKSVSGSVSVIK